MYEIELYDMAPKAEIELAKKYKADYERRNCK